MTEIERKVRAVVGASDTDNGPHLRRLLARLSKSKDFSVAWGDKASAMSVEDRAAALNDMFARGDRGEFVETTADEIDRDTLAEAHTKFDALLADRPSRFLESRAKRRACLAQQSWCDWPRCAKACAP